MHTIDDNKPVRSPHALIHLGAGQCRELDEHLALNPQLLLLVEADPKLADALRERTAGLDQVQVRQTAISSQAGQAIFHRYNLPDSSSLHPASGLRELFPGLKLLEKFSVDTLAPDELLASLQLTSKQDNILVIDTPGAEFAILNKLQQKGQLYLFRQLRVYCGRDALYEGSQPAAEIVSWLEEQGFDLLEEDISQDPERPWLIFQRNAMLLQNLKLQQQIEHVKKQLEVQAAERKQHIEQLSKEQDGKSKQLTELQAQLEQTVKERDAHAKLAGERQTQLDEMTQERDAQAKLAGERQAQLDEMTQEREEQAKLADERHAQLTKMTQERNEQAKLAEERQAQLAKMTQERDEQARLADERQAQLAQMTQERDAQAKMAEEHQAQLEQMTQERDAQAKQVEERQALLEQATKERDDQAQMARERQERINQMDRQITEMEHSKGLLTEEIHRASGQIDLIKDVLMRVQE